MKELAKKLSLIACELDAMKKGGYNENQRYKYIKESDIANEIRPILAKHCVVIIPTVLSHEREKIEKTDSRSGEIKISYFTTVQVGYQIIDADSGEELKCTFFGTGNDSLDKGIYKAYTGAHKYMLLKVFNLGSDDDPENESASKTSKPPSRSGPLPSISTSKGSAPPAAPQKEELPAFDDYGKSQPTTTKDCISEKQAGLLAAKAYEAKWKKSDIVAFIKAKYNISGLRLLGVDQMDEALGYVQKPFSQAMTEIGAVPFESK